jgi:ferrochelatase
MDARATNNPYSLAYQSKVGPKKWLEPSTDDEIARLISTGHKNILVVPIAFVSDHTETIHELGDESRHKAEKLGIEQFEVTEGLNDSPLFIEALKELAIRELDLL